MPPADLSGRGHKNVGRARKWPLWAGDRFTEVTVKAGLTVYSIIIFLHLLYLIKHAVITKSCYFMVLSTFTEPIRKKSIRGYENQNRTEPWKSWTVPALIDKNKRPMWATVAHLSTMNVSKIWHQNGTKNNKAPSNMLQDHCYAFGLLL